MFPSNRIGMFWNWIIFCISNQVFFTFGLSVPSQASSASLGSVSTASKESDESSTSMAFNCGDTRVSLYYSSVVTGTGVEASSPGECRAVCRAGEGCTAWSWFSSQSDSRSLRCFTGRETGTSVASTRAISGAQICKFSSLSCLVSANIYHSTGQCSDMEEDRRFSYSTADTEYSNVWPYQCRLLCRRTAECQAWTSRGRSKCVLLREETGKQQAEDWSLGTKTCGSKCSYLFYKKGSHYKTFSFL